MSYTPMYRTQTGPPWTPTITLDSGNAANIAGSTSFVLYIRDASGLTSERIGGGTVTITNGAAGQISYPWGANDTAIVGKFSLQFQWLNAAGQTQMTDPVPWEIKPI